MYYRLSEAEADSIPIFTGADGDRLMVEEARSIVAAREGWVEPSPKQLTYGEWKAQQQGGAQ